MHNYIKNDAGFCDCKYNTNNWFLWEVSNISYAQYETYIKGYIFTAEQIYNLLKQSNIANDQKQSLLITFLFSVRQSLELILKTLYMIYEGMFYKNEHKKYDHNMLNILECLKNVIPFTDYNLEYIVVKDIVTFMFDKDQFFRYPVNTNDQGHDAYYINISSLLHLVNCMFEILTTEANLYINERNGD